LDIIYSFLSIAGSSDSNWAFSACFSFSPSTNCCSPLFCGFSASCLA
jgi:hypothetical protein